MHRPWIVPLLASLATAQQVPADLQARMKQMSEVLGHLEKAVAGPDRTTLPAALDALTSAASMLPEAFAAGEARTAATLWLGALNAAAADLRGPRHSPATDAHDLGRLRAACTSCHLQVRSDNEARGLFPNRGNAVFGTLRLEAIDGVPRDERHGVVVFLEGGPKTGPLGRAPAISQKGRSFDPPVLVVTPGTTVRFPNDDLVFHNVFSLSRGSVFDLGMYGKGVEKEQVFANPGLVKVHCNIHPDMAAHVLVLESRLAAITAANGFWAIPDVPDGDYTLRAWHALGELPGQRVRCAGGTAVPVALTLRETKARVQHTNKHGRPYREKY